MFKNLITIALLFVGGIANAADLTLICSAKYTNASGSQFSYVDKLEFSYDSHTVTMSRYRDGDLQSSQTHVYISISDTRILIADNDIWSSAVDRITGEYYLKRYDKGSTARGNCEKRDVVKPKF